MLSARPRRILFAAIFFTNLLSLACQVIWVRKLSFLFGSTAAVFATVLSVFLLGLAAGAFVGGRAADRSPRRARLLALSELVLGAWCALSMPIFAAGGGAFLRLRP